MARRTSIVCLLLILGTLIPRPSASQTSPVPADQVVGVVIDPNRNPLPRVSLKLTDSNGVPAGQTFTDEHGRFGFTALSQTDYTLTAELVGFQPLSQQVKPGSALDLLLPVSPVREQVIVTATRTSAPSGQLGVTTTVVTQEEVETKLLLPVSDALRAVPGVSVVRSGGVGSTTSLFVRGGEADHNKLFLDGIPLNEAGGAFDWANLTAENLERVEVVRGPQSALFGTDAMTGVVQLFTRPGRAETPRPRFSLSAEGGNNDTWRTRAGISGEAGALDYSAHWARFSTDNREPNNAFHNTTLSTNLGAQLGTHTSLRLIGRGELGRVGTPGQTAFARPDLDAFLRRRDAFVGLTLHNQTSSAWEQRLRYTYAQSRQVSRNLILDPPYVPSFQGRIAPFPFFDFLGDFLNHTRRHHLSYQSDWRTGGAGAVGQHQLTFAFEWDRELAFLGDRLSPGSEVNAQRDNFGWVFQHQALWERFFLTNSVRVEDNDSFGTTIVPRSSLAYHLRHGNPSLGATKLKFNFGLGIKEPSPLESFSPGPFAFGNPALAAERTRSFDAGVEQRFWRDQGKLEVNWFDNRFRDLIAFEITNFAPLTGSFFNIGRTRAKGTEIILELAPGGGLRGRGTYTFLDTLVTRTGTVFDPVFEEGNHLLRRPKHAGALEIQWDWRRLTLASTAVFVGRRTDTDFSLLGLTSNKNYTKWDLAWNYRAAHGVVYFGLVENLLNQDYMEVLGFPALKLTFRAGVRTEF